MLGSIFCFRKPGSDVGSMGKGIVWIILGDHCDELDRLHSSRASLRTDVASCQVRNTRGEYARVFKTLPIFSFFFFWHSVCIITPMAT